ncbi:MAG TPA: Rha family transcriptional regulator [Candidatus Levilactobacillus faecigallinarum]|uniref:Rha family transcriptional regulator n=1 Tax=Candidatus Levilactobacillus faecigallinarum TaxID=2838638 RepID=A0A9D1QUF5_9LACO|nr:Rha family transcriptional regulator [Candidatus Levilactobacillus faecigallinarum]
MNDLVFLPSQRVDAEPFTTGDVIAKYAEVERDSVNRMIRNTYQRLERFGKVGFEIRPMPSGQDAKTYLLNQQQATLLITFLKNTPRVADFKEELVRQFYAMQRELIERRARFEMGKEYSKELDTAVSESQIDMHGHQYSNFNRLIYRQALGVDSIKLRKARSIPQKEAITHYLSSDEAEAVRKVKRQVITLLGMGMNYQQVKDAMRIQGVVYQITLRLPVKGM